MLSFLASSRFPGSLPRDQMLMVGDDVRDDVIGNTATIITLSFKQTPHRGPGGGVARRFGEDREIQSRR